MNIITTKIQEIEMNEEYLLLKCTNINLNIKIINGTIDIIIKTTSKDVVGYTYLEKNDIIKVLYIKKNSTILPKKIYVNTKYTFNSDSSESETI
uniref:Uncharacterized protein n=1 Tax=viral metagenome TaxID=1070528 RepID=A0A6C0J3B1_9ZZZZ